MIHGAMCAQSGFGVTWQGVEYTCAYLVDPLLVGNEDEEDGEPDVGDKHVHSDGLGLRLRAGLENAVAVGCVTGRECMQKG